MRRSLVLALGVAVAVIALRGYSAEDIEPPAGSAVKIGFELAAQGVARREELAGAIRAQLAARASSVEPSAGVAEGCDGVVFCVSVIAVPVRVGRREGGLAIASYVTRRLIDHPQWPWRPSPAEQPASPVVIENAFTVGGKVECAPCERALEDLREAVGTVKAITRKTMADEGDLNLVVGPANTAFVTEVAAGIAARFVDGHLEPWLKQKQ